MENAGYDKYEDLYSYFDQEDEDGEGGEQASASKLSMANHYGAQDLSFEGAREVEALVC